MEMYKCANAVCIPPDKKQSVEEAIARFLEAETNIVSPIHVHVTLTLDSLNQVAEMRTAWRMDKEEAKRLGQRMTFSRAIGLNGRLYRFSEQNAVRLNPFFGDEIVKTFLYLREHIPHLGQHLIFTTFQIPPNYTPMKLVINLNPQNNEGLKILKYFITDCLGQSDNDWFALRFHISIDHKTGVVNSLYFGTGWQTPPWAEMRDRGPSFSEKERFQSFFANWFKEAGISNNPTTSEEVVRFFEVMLKACPDLSEYFTIIEK